MTHAASHGPDPVHRHRWAVIDFVVADGRPMMRQRCSCGSERDLRAWDRHWEPPNPVDSP